MARVGALAMLAACRTSGAGSTGEPRAAEAKAPEAGITAQSAPSPAVRVDATPPADFEGEFAYGADDGAKNVTPSPAGIAALKAGKTQYTRYANGRFGFTVDVPDSFRAMPAPANGDGMQYRLGPLAVMTASGMFWSEPGFDGTCPASNRVTARKETATTCFATGKANGFIFWERAVIAHGVLYSLRFQYVESLKDAMDPVVTHVNESWSF